MTVSATVDDRLKKLAGEDEQEDKGLIDKFLGWRKKNSQDAEAFVQAWKKEMAENPNADPAQFARDWSKKSKAKDEKPLPKEASDIVDNRLKKLAEGEDGGSSVNIMEKVRNWIKENPEVAKKILGQAAVGAGVGGASGYMLGGPENRLKGGLGGMVMGTGIGGALGSQDFLNRVADKPEPSPAPENKPEDKKGLFKEWSDRSKYFLFGE